MLHHGLVNDPANRAVVDEFCKLYALKQVWAPKAKRLDELTSQIRSWYPDLAPDATGVAAGTGCEVQIGECPVEKRWRSIHAVYKAVGGLKPFLSVCTVTFKAVADVLGNTRAEALQVSERGGSRRLKGVMHATPAIVLEMPKAA